jgi:hypothetical protein
MYICKWIRVLPEEPIFFGRRFGSKTATFLSACVANTPPVSFRPGVPAGYNLRTAGAAGLEPQFGFAFDDGRKSSYRRITVGQEAAGNGDGASRPGLKILDRFSRAGPKSAFHLKMP